MFDRKAVSWVIPFLCLIVQQGSYSLEDNRENNHVNKRLILISLDGFRWDYLNGRAKTPNFDSIRRHGVFARKGLINQYLTNTLPNHFTLVTGLHVENHGFVDNFMYDAETGQSFIPKYFNKDSVNHPDWHSMVGEPIWVTNQLQGETAGSGVIMWMGGEVQIKGVRPTKHVKHDYSVRDHKGKVDTLVRWFTDQNTPINLGIVYFPEPDDSGHKFGPDSKEVTERIEELDDVIGYLFKELKDKGLLSATDVIITSDHGMVSVSKSRLVLIDEIVDPTWYKHASYMPGPVASVVPDTGKEDEIYTKLKAASEAGGHFRVFRKKDIPERFHYKNNKRVPPIFVTADPGYTIADDKSLATFWLAGNHGYDNQLQDMHPFFVATGPSFKENYELDTFASVDIYPLMCHILGLKPAQNNGSMATVSLLLKGSNFYDISTLIYCGITIFSICVILFSMYAKRIAAPAKTKAS